MENFFEILETLSKLKMSNKIDRSKSYKLVSDLWLVSYNIGIQEIKFSKQEKLKACDLILKSIDFFNLEINLQISEFNENLLESTLKKRSGIQFILDNFKSKKLESEFKIFKEEGFLSELTETLEFWSKENMILENPPNKIPYNHFWWNLFIKSKNCIPISKETYE